ncbi:MAG TPA: glycerophosphodiester phosphodiesterase family protein [Chryseolinea sp.]|nr:glycerophosphodiester phosphodiesterase family protein [Chryseolinea sp.]
MLKQLHLVLIFVTAASATSAQYIPKFDIQGHRGARGLMPENTIPAFLTALDSGVTTIELDVVVTKDKQLVLSHEPWMAASICYDSAGGIMADKDEKKFNIYQMTYTQVSKFDCGAKENGEFPEQKKISASKPLLRDVIVAVENRIKSYNYYEVDYNIEIKSSPETDKKFHPSIDVYSELIYELLDEYLPLDRVVIQSFDFRVLKYWHEKHPEIRLSALVGNTKSIDTNLEQLGFLPSVYSPQYKLIDKAKVQYLHSKKIRVIPWTVNDTRDMLALKGMGVDGLITDYPNRSRRFRMTLNIPNKSGR